MPNLNMTENCEKLINSSFAFQGRYVLFHLYSPFTRKRWRCCILIEFALA